MTANWIDRAIGYVSPLAAARRARARAYLDLVARRYDAAGGSRATYGWLTPATSANAEIYGALPILRTRARDLARNNPHAAKAVTALVNNTIGSGIVARPKTGDQNLDRRIVGLWQDFVKEIDADGQLDFYGLQNLVARAFFESGEVLVRRRVRRTNDGLQVPLQYQVLEGDFLDHAKNEDLANGQVRMGVEFDGIGRRRAYWMFPEHPGEGRYGAAARGKSRAVPADQILHLYEKQRPGQIRGVPWLTPVMLKLRELDDYEEAEIVRKRLEACVAAIVFGEEEEEQGIAPTIRDGAGNLIEQFEPGLIAYARGGKDIKFTQPSVAGGYAEYKRAQLHTIAAGARVTYELLTGDLSQVNYSSIRAGLVEFRRMIRALQWSVIIPMLCQPVWKSFIDLAVVSGRLPADTPYGVEWTPPRFEAVDPVKDNMATIMAVRAGLMSLQEAISSFGYDPDDILEEIAQTNEKLDSLGLVLDSDPRRVTKQGAGQATEFLALDDDPEATPEDTAAARTMSQFGSQPPQRTNGGAPPDRT